MKKGFLFTFFSPLVLHCEGTMCPTEGIHFNFCNPLNSNPTAFPGKLTPCHANANVLCAGIHLLTSKRNSVDGENTGNG